nr:immunoglobulin light chain junction region [Macaca mulatta]
DYYCMIWHGDGSGLF